MYHVFDCPYCDVIRDRDVNGTNNLFIRFLTKFKEAMTSLERKFY